MTSMIYVTFSVVIFSPCQFFCLTGAPGKKPTQGFTPSRMFEGPRDSTLIMMGVPSLKMGFPSFYINFEFWKVVHASVKGFEQALAVKQVSQNIKSFLSLNHLYR